MITSNLRRDEDAVSAAVATVLLFGGVITIIGVMLLSMHFVHYAVLIIDIEDTYFIMKK